MRLSCENHDRIERHRYELRCADPIPYDMEYTRDLGYCDARYVLGEGHGAMVSMQEGRFVPVPFDEMMVPEIGRTRLRLIHVNSARYGIARRCDFANPRELERLARAANMSVETFRRRFEPLTRSEPPFS